MEKNKWTVGLKKYKFLILMLFMLQVTLLSARSSSEERDINEIIKLDDDRYKIEVEGNGALVVRVPEGRPRIPQIECEGAEITQAFLSEGYKEAIAKVKLDDNYYVIRFTKDPDLGFELQYDDRYTFKPEGFEAESYTSSNPDAVVVDEFGNIKVVGVSDRGAIITARKGSYQEELEITRTSKAPLGVYLLEGQSNAAYYLADTIYATETKPGTSYIYAEKVGDVLIKSMNNEDGSMAVGNIEASLAATLYEELGEKVLIVNTAVPGAPMDSFVPNQGSSYIFLNKVWQIVKRHIEHDDFVKNYDVHIRSYIWLQGEADKETNIGLYKSDYIKFHQMLTSEDYGFDYGFIIKVRPEFKNSAQALEELVQENEDIAMATRSTEKFSTENGKLDEDEVHYTQLGDNQIGNETGRAIARAYLQGIDTVKGYY